MKNIILKILAGFFVLGSIGVGLYVGGWWMFLGGIVQIIEEVRAETISQLNIGIALAKIFLGPTVGILCVYGGFVGGIHIFPKHK